MLIARFRYRMAWLSDVGTLATHALAARGLSWGRVSVALTALATWAVAIGVLLTLMVRGIG
jgi:hypothetical protein